MQRWGKHIEEAENLDPESRIQELEKLLEIEVERKNKAEERYWALKREFDQRLEEKLQDKQLEIEEEQVAQVSLSDNLLETTLLVEEIHAKFAAAVDDIEEGVRSKTYEFQQTSETGPDLRKHVRKQSVLLDRMSRILNKLEESKTRIALSVGELKSTVFDLTKQLQSSDDRYKSIFKRVKDGILIVDAKWNITDINTAMCEILGYNYRRLAMDRNVSKDIFADPMEFEIFEKDIIMSGFVRNYETRFLDESGGRIDVLVSCTAIWNNEDVLVGYEGIVHDITEQKKLEQQRIDMQRLEAVNNMVIAINHNMNQNLTVIYNYCQIIKEDMKNDDEFSKLFQLIYVEVEKLIELIRKITMIKELHTMEYVDGVQMLDIEKSTR